MTSNIAKDYCDCVISWEVQESRKISSVVHCSFSANKAEITAVGDVTGTLYSIHPEDVETEFSPVLLTPFLHPEMTQASYCDLKVFISPKLGVKIDRLIIVSTAKTTEYYDRHGEMLFLVKGVKMINRTEWEQENTKCSKTDSCKSSTRWFRSEYILSVDTFEVMARFCDYLVHNQLFIKYIGVKIIPHDWSSEFGSLNLINQSMGTSVTSHMGNNCPNNVTVNLDKVLEAIQNVNNAVQHLTNEVGCSHQGSNPHLATASTSETSNLLKHRRPNSPMTSTTVSSSSNYLTGAPSRRNSDICNLQLWIETHLTILEMTFSKGIDKLSTRLSKLEEQIRLTNHTVPDSNERKNQQTPSIINDVTIESTNSPNDTSNGRNSACHRF